MLNMKGGTYFKAIGLVLFAVILFHVDLEEVWRQFKQSNPFLVAAAVILILPQVALRAFRWQQMLARQAIHCPFRFALSVYFAGIYIGLMTPGRLGEIAKAFFLKQRGLASLSQSMPSVILDRCLDLYCLLMFALISLYPLGMGRLSPMATGIICIVVGATPWLVVYLWRLSSLPDLIRNTISARLGTKWVETFTSFNEVVDQLVSRKVVCMLLITVASYGIYFLQTYLIGRSIGLDIGFSAVAMIVSIAILVGFIPVTIAGLGTREAVFIFLFGRFGISPASALSFAFLYNLVYIACVGMISAFFWMRLPDRQELKNVQKTWVDRS